MLSMFSNNVVEEVTTTVEHSLPAITEEIELSTESIVELGEPDASSDLLKTYDFLKNNPITLAEVILVEFYSKVSPEDPQDKRAAESRFIRCIADSRCRFFGSVRPNQREAALWLLQHGDTRYEILHALKTLMPVMDEKRIGYIAQHFLNQRRTLESFFFDDVREKTNQQLADMLQRETERCPLDRKSVV